MLTSQTHAPKALVVRFSTITIIIYETVFHNRPGTQCPVAKDVLSHG